MRRPSVASRALGACALLALAAAPASGVGAQDAVTRGVSPTASLAAPAPLLVRAAGGRERRLQVARDERGDLVVRADELASLTGATFVLAAERWTMRLRGVLVELRDGLPFAVVGRPVEPAALVPLLSAPYRENGFVWTPVQVATDLLPRVVGGVRWDASARTLLVGGVGGAPSSTVTAAPRTSDGPLDRAGASDAAPDRVDEPGPTVRLPTIRGRRAPAAAPPAASAASDGRVAAAAPRPRRDAAEPIRPVPAAEEAEPAAASALAGPRRVVVVDAGHGGVDTGMRGPLGGGPQVTEKAITLGVARALRDALLARGVGVALTRAGDTLVALADRGRIANQRRGDLFVSIHVNAANPAWRNPAGERGFETYFLSEARTDDARRVAQLENESVRFETGGATAGDPLAGVLADMAANEHLRESARLAALVQRRLARVHPGPSRGVKQAGFKVLVTASMPAILVEVGYGTNPQEAAFLSSARGQRVVAGAVADAAVEYLATRGRRAPRVGAGADAGRGTGDRR